MIETRQLTRYFGARCAVAEVNLEVATGQVLVVLGRIGSGKSTLLRLLAGYLLPSRGSITIAGLDLARQRLGAQRRLGYVPQVGAIYAEMRVRGFLRYVGALRGLRGLERERSIEGVTERLGLAPVLDVPLARVSPDWRWRIGLAQAMLHDPVVLLLDEPGEELDDRQRRALHTVLDGYARGRSIVIASRLPDAVQVGCDQVALLHHGQLIATATPQDLLAKSRYCGAVSFTAAHAAVARQALVRLAGVVGIETDPRDGRTTVFAGAGAHILDGVLAVLRDLEVNFSELQLERGRLGDVLDGLVARHEAAA